MTSSATPVRRVQRYGPALLGVLVAAGVWASATGAMGVRSPLPRALVLAVAVASGVAAATVRARRWPLVVAAARLRPDVVLLDVRMPGTDGLTAAPAIVAAELQLANRVQLAVLVHDADLL